MTITILLTKQIVSLLLMMGCGYILVKTGLLKAEESHTISVMTIYILLPCVVINAFRISYSTEIRNNFLLAVGAAVLVHIVMIILCHLLKGPLHLNNIDQASILYPNSANLIVPLVTAVLGEEWVIYSSAYICVQIFFIWTHGLRMIHGTDAPISFRKILLNPNLIAAALGLVLFFFPVPIPSVIDTTISSIAKTIGPITMMMIGMLLSTYDLKEILRSRHLVLVVFLRLILFPLVILLMFKYSGMVRLASEGQKVLLISLLAISAPAATSVTQMAQIAGQDARYAGLINAATTLGCVVTMPLMIFLYLL